MASPRSSRAPARAPRGRARARRNGLLKVPSEWVDSIAAATPGADVRLDWRTSPYASRWEKGMLRVELLGLLPRVTTVYVSLKPIDAMASFSPGHLQAGQHTIVAQPTIRIVPFAGRPPTGAAEAREYRATARHELQHFTQYLFDAARIAEALPWPKKFDAKSRTADELSFLFSARLTDAWGHLHGSVYTDMPMAGGPPKRALAQYAHDAGARPRGPRGARDRGSSDAATQGRHHADFDIEAHTDLQDAVQELLDDWRDAARASLQPAQRVQRDRGLAPLTFQQWTTIKTKDLLKILVARSRFLQRWRATHPAKYRWALGQATGEIRREVERIAQAEGLAPPLSARVRMHNILAERERVAQAAQLRAAAEKRQAEQMGERRRVAELKARAQSAREEADRRRRAAQKDAQKAARKAEYEAKIARFKRPR